MKFRLKPPYAQLSDEELLDDLRSVAALTGRDFVVRSEYEKHGKHARGTLARRFGSWKAAHVRAGLDAHARDAATSETLLRDLRRVAGLLGRDFVALPEYRQHGRWSEQPFVRVFGGWLQALDAAGLKRHPQAQERIPDEKLFENLELMWTRFGRQPRYSELSSPDSKYSAATYRNRFGTWRQALENFVRWVNDESVDSLVADFQKITARVPAVQRSGMKSPATVTPAVVRRTSRQINLRLRFRVLQRDRFTCRACGRSPASLPGLVLHVDHVVSWSAGGETVLGNLQSLCDSCNLGKGNLPVEKGAG